MVQMLPENVVLEIIAYVLIAAGVGTVAFVGETYNLK